jgi:hypothetical protein
MLIMQPSFVTADLAWSAIKQAGKKKSLPALSKLRYEAFTEGACAQIMHIGPFSEEGPTIEKVHNFFKNQGTVRRGKPHEIYLSDIRKADPAKWKTIIRQPLQ